MELPFLWEISIPFTFLYLPLTIAYGNCISACILLAEALIAFVNEIHESTIFIRYKRLFGHNVRFFSREWKDLLSLPHPLSIAYIFFCMAVGLKFSLYQLDIRLPYDTFCGIISFIVLIYGIYYVVRMDEEEEMFIVLYNILISLICSIPITRLWLWIIHKKVLFFNIPIFLWHALFWAAILFFLLLRSFFIKKKIISTGKDLFYCRKMLFLPIYYIMQIYHPFIHTFTEENPSINWNVDLSCMDKKQRIAKELMKLEIKIKRLPKYSIFVTETHEAIIKHLPNPIVKIPVTFLNRKVNTSFRSVYGSNWTETDMCTRCPLYPDKMKCSVSCHTRKAYMVFFR